MHIGFNIAIAFFLLVSVFAVFFLGFSKTKKDDDSTGASPDGSGEA